MTIGGHKGVRLPIEGSELDGVLLNADFLRNCSMGKETGLGEKVIVLGGGNVAFDCARSAKRLGAKEIHVACLEAREKMTADNEEIEQAKEEGIFVHPAQTFERITGTTHVTGVDFMNVKSFTFDENRRAIIEKEEDSMHHIAGDTVIFAVGQRPDISSEAGLELGRGNSIVVNNITNDKTTSVAGIFAAGDAIYGTKSVIMAIESGREAAIQIDQYLGGDGDISDVLAPKQIANAYIGEYPNFAYQTRVQPQVDEPSERCNNFNLFDHGICDHDICHEASRCLQCDLRLQISRPRLWGDFVESKEAD
ncbi:MAG: FAD-dependent oxidoreductase, partial [Sharpea porci]